MNRSRANGCRVLYKHLKSRADVKSKRGYQKRRVALDSLGYETYSEYLQSDMWKAIRDAVLLERPYCAVCARKATEVHHFCYLDAVLVGLANDMLFPMCHECHHRVEFEGDAKRHLIDAQYFLVHEFNNTGRRVVSDRLMHRYRLLKRQDKRRKR